MRGTRRWTRVVGALVASALALTVVACGSDGGDETAASAASGEAADKRALTRSGGDPNGTKEERVRAAYDAMIDAIYGQNYRAACKQFSRRARTIFAGNTTCLKQFDRYFSNLGSGLADRPRVVEYESRGNKATVGAKTRESNVYPIPLVYENGAWRIDGGFNGAGG